MFGIRKFQKYLYGAEFVLKTDHAPLSNIQKCKIESGRIMRWGLFLQNYQFKVEAIKGSDNVCADYLRRQQIYEKSSSNICIKFCQQANTTTKSIVFAVSQDVQTVGLVPIRFNIYLKPVQFIMLNVPPFF